VKLIFESALFVIELLRMINWSQISEVEFLDMLEDKYVADGYSVDVLHNKRELGVDILAARNHEEIVILAKMKPTQSDTSQPPLAKQSHPNATKYIYYYVGEAAAPFVSIMRNTYPEFELRNEDETEKEMFASNNVFVFRCLIKYSVAFSRIARLIQKAYTIDPLREPDIPIDETVFRKLLEAHEGIVQIREINNMAIAALRNLIDEYQDYNNEILIEKTKQSTISFISRLDEASNKLNGLLKLNSKYLYGFFQGSSVWGGTYNGAFLPVELDLGDWARYSNKNERRHFYKILDYMIVAFRERIPYYNYGVPEAVGCFLSVEHILGLLKKTSANLMNIMFQRRT